MHHGGTFAITSFSVYFICCRCSEATTWMATMTLPEEQTWKLRYGWIIKCIVGGASPCAEMLSVEESLMSTTSWRQVGGLNMEEGYV